MDSISNESGIKGDPRPLQPTWLVASQSVVPHLSGDRIRRLVVAKLEVHLLQVHTLVLIVCLIVFVRRWRMLELLVCICHVARLFVAKVEVRADLSYLRDGKFQDAIL